MGGRMQRWVGGLAVVVALSGCGGGSQQAERIDTGGPTTTTVEATTPTVEATTTSLADGSVTTARLITSTTRRATTTTKKKTRPLPGPATPGTPLAEDVSRWHPLLTAMTAASCTRIVDETTAKTDLTALEAVIVLVYRGAGEGCLGRTTSARTHLEQARTALGKLTARDLDRITPPCRPQELLSWAFFTYLDTDIPTGCTATSTSTSSTSSTTLTTLRATTTSRL